VTLNVTLLDQDQKQHKHYNLHTITEDTESSEICTVTSLNL